MIQPTPEQVYDVMQRYVPEDGHVSINDVRNIMEAAIALLGNNPETFEKLADEKRWQ